MREPKTVEEYVAGLYEYELGDVATHVIRTVILEQSTLIDAALNDILAMRYARDQAAADVLADDVFSRLPMAHRIDMLVTLLNGEELHDRWPLLVESLRRLNRLRNELAHGFVERLPEESFQVTTFNRGAVKRHAYQSRQLAWLAWQAQVVVSDLRCLWATLIPDVDDWFGPEPDAEA